MIANPAHRVLHAIGLGHYIGVWQHMQSRKNKTPNKGAKHAEKKRDIKANKASTIYSNIAAGRNAL